MMLISWATRIAEAPKTDLEFWKNLFPVAVAHTIWHVAATVSMSKVAVSFTQIIKSGEPAFSVLVSRFLMGETFPVPVYLSLIPIIGGCGLAAVTELNFNMTGFMGAMISNLAFVFRNIFSKKGMKGKSVGGMNYYACLSLLSLLILTPFAIAVEGPQMWAIGWEKAVSQIGPQFIWWVAAQSVFYHLYNQVSYMSLNEISPLTFSIGNTMKRISVIVSSIIIFHMPVQPVNALGAAIAILGTFLYSQVPYVSFIATLSCCIVHYFPNFVTSSAFIMCKVVRKLESGNLGMFCNIDDLEKICCEDLFGLDDDSSIHYHRGSKKANQELFFL
ncbi:hypothetical protein CsSME_00018340 [Camellia sinensis var. sinensis]